MAVPLPRLYDPLTGARFKTERLRAYEMLDGGLFTFARGDCRQTH